MARATAWAVPDVVWGVRSRTTLWATLLVLVTLVLAGAALVASQRHTLTDNVDEVLSRQNTQIARDIDKGTLGNRLAGQGDDESFALIVDPSGAVTASTTNSPTTAELKSLDGSDEMFRSMRIGKPAQDFRVMSTRHSDLTITTGTPLDDVNDSVSTLTRGLSIAVPSVTLLLAGLVWLMVGRVLRPVEEIRRQVAEISGSSLDRRVPDPRTRDEIARLSQTMNGMLERLESYAARQQRFVADASHELRRPLARIRTELEVDFAHPETANLERTHHSLLEETGGLQRLVDDLLLLARSDNASLPGRRDPVDLDDIVLSEVQRFRGNERVSVDTSGLSAAQVLGDAPQLARAVRNLLDNACQHGGPAVVVSLGEVDGEAVLSIADDGDGIPANMQERVFERFARVDEARAPSGATATNGTGLGLSIAREIASAHGGTVTIDPTYTRGTRFLLRLPLAPHVTT